jgi:hypothetical protein
VICVYWDVVEVKAEEGPALFVRFADGLSGRVYFDDSYFRGVFEHLRNPDLFRQAYVDHGAVAWPGEIDLAPDAMYREIRARGVWRLAAASIRDSAA